jgi:predicted flavoprotein YhiN
MACHSSSVTSHFLKADYVLLRVRGGFFIGELMDVTRAVCGVAAFAVALVFCVVAGFM